MTNANDVCVAGNGPSAKGQGRVIDDIGTIVRIKEWWKHGAEDAGVKCDIWAHYGLLGDGESDAPESAREQWITQTVEHIESHTDGWARLSHINSTSQHRPLRWLTGLAWSAFESYLGSHPSTGFIAVAMAMAILKPARLALYGFDGTTPDRPNYNDARGPVDTKFSHDQLAEKRAFAEIAEGTWLGEPTTTKLTWPDMPEGVVF